MKLKKVRWGNGLVYRGDTVIAMFWKDKWTWGVNPLRGKGLRTFRSRKAALQWIDEEHSKYIMGFFEEEQP